MAETFDPHCVWFVGAGPGDRDTGGLPANADRLDQDRWHGGEIDDVQAVVRLRRIARALGVSLRTVRRRVAALMEECGVETRFQLAVKLTERGLTGFEG